MLWDRHDLHLFSYGSHGMWPRVVTLSGTAVTVTLEFSWVPAPTPGSLFDSTGIFAYFQGLSLTGMWWLKRMLWIYKERLPLPFLQASWVLMPLLFYMRFKAILFSCEKKPSRYFCRIYRERAFLLHIFFRKVILTLVLLFFLMLIGKTHTNRPTGRHLIWDKKYI